MFKNCWEEFWSNKTSRRSFIASAAAAGCTAILAGHEEFWSLFERAQAGNLTPEDEYILNNAENTILTTCLNCNTGCAIKTKFLNGNLVKIDGNPYSPWTMYPHIAFASKIREAAQIDGAICPKGHAGVQIYADPYRIRKVLKRAGKRGENKWVSIPFSQAIEEIAGGGKLFANVPGEEDRVVEGMNDLWTVRDPKVAKEMGDYIEKIFGEKDKAKKGALVQEFQVKFKDHLGGMIDPNHPDLGPKNNQFVFWWGRLKDGRGDFIKRFTLDSMGSTNAHGHTTVCQGSLYFAGKAMSEQWGYDAKKNAMTWSGGKKFYWQGELESAEFVIFVGANVFEANYGPPLRGSRIAEGVSSGQLKYVVIDPHYIKAAAHAWKWLPVIPGRDTPIALGMIRWIIENNKYDHKYLVNANKGSANAAIEPTWTNATWLVKIENNRPTNFLKSHEIGFEKEIREKDGKSYTNDQFVVLSNGTPVSVDPNSTGKPVTGELFVNTEIKGFKVKSVFQILYEESTIHTLEEWATEAGVKSSDIEELAREFTSHGKKAVADIHRGVSQHTSGYYDVQAWNTLNLLIGNYDYRGGFIAKTDYNSKGDKPGQAFDISKHPQKAPNFGIPIIRSGTKYEDTTLFSGYPAKRPWFPLSSDVYQEMLPSAMDMYPYQIKTLFLYMGSPIYSLPAGQSMIDTLLDINKIPLFVTFDITVGETSVYADYIIPDLTYLERWEMQGGHPSVPYKTMPIRQPAAKPLTEMVTVFGEEMPLGLESFILGLAEKLNLPGFGPNGFGPNIPLTHFDHLYLKQIANIATDGSLVPDADDDEMQLFLAARKHLPRGVFDVDRWKSAAGDAYWRKVVYVLNRGGRWQDYNAAWDGDKVKNKYGTQVNMYCEKTAQTKNSMTGLNFSGIATYVPGPRDVLGNPIEDEKDGYDLTMITGRVIEQTKSRTISSYWLLTLNLENSILINSIDAAQRGLREGNEVKITSMTNPDGVWKLGPLGDKLLIGKIKVTEEIRPGVIFFPLGYGHFAYGSRDIVIDGTTLKGDPRRATGIHANVAMRVDPVLKNVGLQDLVGGSIVFYDTKVKLVKT
ncbi:molybdopterin-dependent oxidoreductase [Pelosinus sp. IPA-1]|uniref:molybdopterin-dependent oxidoreductase n=1 Tax=Pelosinus sp. IPA-1 TaxID=3029569 RepID=UPI0024361EDC|nr:molybdopterin-dependent oxidoreductase [Pelosinus sp. IPA-1]GMB01003.1 molybdopterin oxidoreductase [Pelosinus sp. IPA-1]